MDNSLRGVESAVRELQESLRAIEQRLALIEHALAAAGHIGAFDTIPPAAAPPSDDTVPHAPRYAHDLVTVLSYVGRTFVALGGAYLLRALTDSAVLPQPAGIALGLAYSVLWLAM